MSHKMNLRKSINLYQQHGFKKPSPEYFFFAIELAVKDSYLVLILYIILIDVSFKHQGIRIDTNFSLAQKVKKNIYIYIEFSNFL